MSHVAVRSSTLDRVAEKYKVPVRRESWGWHPNAVEVAGKAYAEKMLGVLPNFPVIEHVLNLGQPITLNEAEQLSIDIDDTLTSSLKSVIADFQDKDQTSNENLGEEEGKEEERASRNEDLDGVKDGRERIIPPEGEGSNKDHLEVP